MSFDHKTIETIGMLSAILMPFCNIPLIVKIIQRKSSRDISLLWVAGVWVCVMGMLPSSILSEDPVLKSFGIVNSIFFSGVFFVVLKYHKSPPAS